MKRNDQTMPKALSRTAEGNSPPQYSMRLYVADNSPRSKLAIESVTEICDKYLRDRYTLEIIDIYQQPERAVADQIVAAPTLLKKMPLPLRMLIGDMSDEQRLLAGLDLG